MFSFLKVGKNRRYIAIIIAAAVPLIAIIFWLSENDTVVLLTAEEQDWINKHPVILLAPDPLFPPLEFFSSEGEYRGMIADYFAIIERNLNIRIKFRRYSSWDSVLIAAKEHTIDGVTAAQITPERQTYLQFTFPIIDIPNMIIVRTEFTGSVSLDQLAGKIVVVTRGNALHEYLKNNYPAIRLVTVDNDFEALQQVSFNHADASVINLAVASYLIEQHAFSNLRVAGDSGKKNQLAIAVRHDQTMLRTILDRGLGSITNRERRMIYRRWIGIQDDSSVYLSELWRLIQISIGVIALILIAVILWNRSLQGRVSRRTLELNRELAERKIVEEKLTASIGEKEVLLKEIHHRVKNNMQVISSLLALQGEEIADPLMKQLFRESQYRIRSMALVHERLYRSSNLANIDFGEYLQTVTAELYRSYYREGVNGTTEAQNIQLTVDTAVPCGLIVNELVTNALKHGFRTRAYGTVIVRFQRAASDTVLLEVEDDGDGFPLEIDFRKAQTMGMGLVISLVDQINGKIMLDRSKGTLFSIEFNG